MKKPMQINFLRKDWSTFGKPFPPRIRISVIIFLFIGVVVSSVFLLNNDSSESTTTLATVPVYTYEHEASLAYQVHLKPNDVFETSSPQPGQTYFTKLIDYIDVFASYEFSGDTPTENNGDYNITVYLEANNIPTKSFPVMLNVPDPDLTFEHTAELDYQAHLKPNNFYTNTTLPSGQMYFSNTIDYFDITADYSFNSEGSSQSSGFYEVIGILTSPSYWQKSYVIRPQTPFDASDKMFSTSTPFIIYLDEYRSRADEINAELGIHPRETDLIIQFNVQLDGKSKNGSTTENFSPFMNIPLSSAQFTIDGDLSQTSTGRVSGTGPGILHPQFNSDGRTASFNNSFRIDLAPYQSILDTITAQTGVVPQEPRLVVVLNVNIIAESYNGTIIDNISPQMIIPLSPKTFEISGDLSDSRSGSIDKKDLMTTKGSSGSNTASIVSLVVFSILFVVFTALTRSKLETANRFQQQLKSINRKYSSRMVDVVQLPDAENQQLITVSSIEDIDRIADEIMKPIMHLQPGSLEGRHIFCVLDDSTRYQYVLSEESVE